MTNFADGPVVLPSIPAKIQEDGLILFSQRRFKFGGAF
jgi:hypothetical protein